jgi:hypothetical protein
MAKGPTRPNRIRLRLPECKRALQKRAIETENSNVAIFDLLHSRRRDAAKPARAARSCCAT